MTGRRFARARHLPERLPGSDSVPGGACRNNRDRAPPASYATGMKTSRSKPNDYASGINLSMPLGDLMHTASAYRFDHRSRAQAGTPSADPVVNRGLHPVRNRINPASLRATPARSRHNLPGSDRVPGQPALVRIPNPAFHLRFCTIFFTFKKIHTRRAAPAPEEKLSQPCSALTSCTSAELTGKPDRNRAAPLRGRSVSVLSGSLELFGCANPDGIATKRYGHEKKRANRFRFNGRRDGVGLVTLRSLFAQGASRK